MKQNIIHTISNSARAATTLLLATLMLAAVPQRAGAQSPSGNWADEENRAETVPQSDDGSTLYISSAEQLACYAYGVNHDWMTTGSASGYWCGRTVELLADIDLSAHYWTAIGTNNSVYFNGFFHGNGHVITGMNIVLSTADGSLNTNDNDGNPRIGLFGHIRGRNSGTGTTCITDLTLKDFNVNITTNGSNNVYIGGLVGVCNNNGTTTSITNCCLVNGTVYCNNSQSMVSLGGLVASGTPTECSNNYRCNVSTTAAGITYNPISGESVANCATLTVSGHGSVALGGSVSVMSGGKIYAASGQTVTLSATPEAGYMVSYESSDVTITDGSFTMPANDGATITATFAPDPAHFSQDGDTYTIHTAGGWNVFCDLLADNAKGIFTGKTIVLGADITVTRMAGGSYHDFTGTFDGQGHTLTVSYGSAESPIAEDNAAPFRNVETGCLIENLHVSGDIYTSQKFAGGLVGIQYGTVTIRNCHVSTVIHSLTSGDGTHGGIVGNNGNGSGSSITIEGCLFDGKLLTEGTTATTNCSGFVGYKNRTVTITNSLYVPAALADGETEVQNGTGTISATFVRNGEAGTNCYYTRPLGTAHGKAPRTVTAGADVTISAIALTGTTTEYTVSGITAYSGGGLQHGDDLYYGSGDQLELTLSNTAPAAPAGYQYDGYTASAGTLSGSTLLMPDQDVTISLALAAIAYTITYDLAGGTVATENPTSYTVESEAITLINPTRDGFTFAGWTGTDLTEATETVTIAQGSTGDRTYTATWTKNELALNETDGVTTLTSQWAGKQVEVSFTRTFSSGVASTVCLPFGFEPQGGTFYTFHSVDKSSDPWTVTMNEADPDNRAQTDADGKLLAGVPYLFMPAADGAVSFNGTMDVPTDASTVQPVAQAVTGGWQFVGTFSRIDWTTDPQTVYGFAALPQDSQTTTDSDPAAGVFFRVKGGSNSFALPFRAYLDAAGGGAQNAPARGTSRAASEPLPDMMTVRLVGINGTTTAIGTLDTSTGSVTIDDDSWYTLDGRKLDGKPTAKGLYIHNGRKIIIK